MYGEKNNLSEEKKVTLTEFLKNEITLKLWQIGIIFITGLVLGVFLK